MGDLWNRAPLALKAYVVISLGWTLINLPFALIDSRALAVGFGLGAIPLAAFFCFFLLRGSEGFWWVIFAFGVLGLITLPFPPRPAWYLITGEVILFVLLVAPETRRHCGVGGPGT